MTLTSMERFGYLPSQLISLFGRHLFRWKVLNPPTIFAIKDGNLVFKSLHALRKICFVECWLLNRLASTFNLIWMVQILIDFWSCTYTQCYYPSTSVSILNSIFSRTIMLQSPCNRREQMCGTILSEYRRRFALIGFKCMKIADL